jgi:SAM-dependent methyltransferase
VSAYDRIARLYDPWSVSVVEDVDFYVAEAVRSGGPVLELGVGTGRIAVPIARAGMRVVGVDSSEGMLGVAREAAKAAGVELDLRYGDLRDPPVDEKFGLVVIPFRTLLHMQTDEDRRAALRAVRTHLRDGGRFIFDVFTPGADDIADTHGRWLEREPGIFERAEWD